MLESSKAVYKLSQQEIQDLVAEMNNFGDCWKPHTPPTALKYGKTIYLQQLNDILCKISFSQFDKFPKTHSILKKIAGDEHLSRCYWHKLMPGDCIEKHDDTTLTFVKNKMLAHRYQIYLDSDPNFVMELDGNVVQTGPWEYSIVDFALEKPHFYHNTSNKPWIFMVFDTLHTDPRG